MIKLVDIKDYKEIKGYPDYYVNCNGEIISCKRHKNNKEGTPHKMKPYKDRKGYLVIKLIDSEGKKKNLFVHILVAKNFVFNPNPKNYKYVNHKDRNTSNPNYLNLEWCDMKYNNAYTFTIGEKMKGCKCELYINEMFVKSFVSISEAAKYAVEKYGCNYIHLCNYLSDADKNISIKRLEPIISKYVLYEKTKYIKEFRSGKEAFKYIKEHYNCSLTYRRMYSIKNNIILIKNDEFLPETFWEEKKKRNFNPITYYWDLFYGDLFVKTFCGKRDAVQYAVKNYPDVKYGPLQNNHCSGLAKIEKRNQV